jgi:hypothetical protein
LFKCIASYVDVVFRKGRFVVLVDVVETGCFAPLREAQGK